MHLFTVRSVGGEYPVERTLSVADTVTAINEYHRRGVMVVDGNLYDLHPAIKEVGMPQFFFTADEAHKVLQTVEDLVHFVSRFPGGKDMVLIAVGGGVVQDVATMAAHLYLRGVELVLVPTTLLAQADSCIGSKAGINLGRRKNQIGCFKSPSRVLICHDFIRTLGVNAQLSGLGEILKLHLIGGYTEDALATAIDSLPYAVGRCLLVKKEIIEVDEFEQGKRIWLSYGHTFGHALENVTANEVPHGVAVAWGMDLINYIFKPACYLQVKEFIRKHIPWRLSGLSASDLIAAVRSDKKAKRDRVDLVVLDSPGRLRVHSLGYTVLQDAVEDYLRNHNVYGD